jgi:ABC-type polysaccharide/polyol phosphate export permease
VNSYPFLIDRESRRKLDLLWLLTRKEITLKYKRTFLGILWSLLNPILLALVLFIAFKIFMKIQMENYAFFFSLPSFHGIGFLPASPYLPEPSLVM